MQRSAASSLTPIRLVPTGSRPGWRARLRAALHRHWLSACAQAERKSRQVPYY